MQQSNYIWQGRVDSEESYGTQRWHDLMNSSLTPDQSAYALIGFAVDEGVVRNAGRQGAAQGPTALRNALSNLPVLGEPSLIDYGDVKCLDRNLEAAQLELANQIHRACSNGHFPIVLGGGHEVAWGTFQGVRKAYPDLKNLLIINLDAHFDLRLSSEANSGTPFKQMYDWSIKHGYSFNYKVLGISEFANTQVLFDRAHQTGTQYVLDDDLQTDRDLQNMLFSLSENIQQCDAIYLTTCLDVLPASVAPGVSAPSPLGIPLRVLEQVIELVAASNKLVAADVAELNPTYDIDQRTAKVAARLVARLVRTHQLKSLMSV